MKKKGTQEADVRLIWNHSVQERKGRSSFVNWLVIAAMSVGLLAEASAADFISLADTYVDQGASTVNYGASVLRVEGTANNEQHSYLKFTVTGLVGELAVAKLVMYSTDVVGTVSVYSVPTVTWSEMTMTWDNKPAVGKKLATTSCVAGGLVEFDVTDAISGNGTYSFCLKDYSQSISTRFRGRENSSMPILRIETISWQVIKTVYPTEDMVIAPVTMTADRLPANPATTDCAAAFQAAFAEVNALGGGFVFVPAGEYLFTTPLTIPQGVHLRGDWKPLTETDKRVGGTILKCTYTGSQAFIRLSDRSGVQNVTIWYPDQNLSNPIAYATTIDGKYTHGKPDRTDSVHLENINLVNAWIGISPLCSLPFANVRNIYGSPLSNGIYMYDSSGLPRYSLFNFSADYWSESGLPGAPDKQVLIKYLKIAAVAIKVGSSDNIFAAEWNVKDYNIGVHCFANAFGTLNGNLYGLNITRCDTALLLDKVGPTFFVNCLFEGTEAAVVLNEWSDQVFFNGCTFNAGTLNSFTDAHTTSQHQLSFQSCSFQKKLTVLGKTDLEVVNCNFVLNTAPIVLNKSLQSGIFAGNSYVYTKDPIVLNGADTDLIVISNEDISSQTCPAFDVNGYNKVRKPAAANMIVMGSSGYSVSVDGMTDDAPAIQSALNAVSAMGGGIVMLPRFTQLGYAIRTPITVPTGCELRSSGEGMHAIENQDPIMGAVLQIYFGRNGSTAAITLNAGAGLKGMSIHYPEQMSDSIVPYSFTVRAAQDNVYVEGIQFINAYDGVLFDSSDNHFLEHCFITPIHRCFKVVNSVGGRIQNVHARGDWDDAGFNTFKSWQFNEYSLANCVAYDINGSTDQSIWGTFTRLCKWIGNFTDSTVQALMFSAESSQNGLLVNGIPPSGIDLIGISIRANADVLPTHSMIDATASMADGQLRVYSSLFDGPLDLFVASEDADCLLQQCWFEGGDSKIATEGVLMRGTNPSVVRLENCWMSPPYISTNIANVPNKRLELVGNILKSGIEFHTYQKEMINSLNATPATRICNVANLSVPAVARSLNQVDGAGNSGLKLTSTTYELQTRAVEFKQVFRWISGYRPMGTPKELAFIMDSSLFSVGQEPGTANLEFFYYDWKKGSLLIEYMAAGTTVWKTAATIALAGDNGFLLQEDNTTDQINPFWIHTSVLMPGYLFTPGSRIRLRVVGGDAIFSYVSLIDTGDVRILPYGGY